jgi:hypothetical protein
MLQETQKSKEKAITEIRCMVQEQDRLRREIQQYRYDKKRWAKVLQGLLILVYFMRIRNGSSISSENTDRFLELKIPRLKIPYAGKRCEIMFDFCIMSNHFSLQ